MSATLDASVMQIRLDQIDDLMAEAVQELVQKTTLRWTELTVKATPRDSGDLANSWKTDIRKFKGTISFCRSKNLISLKLYYTTQQCKEELEKI